MRLNTHCYRSLGTLLAAAVLAVAGTGVASAAPAVPPPTGAPAAIAPPASPAAAAAPAAAVTDQETFTAQPLPTWQTNGVVYVVEYLNGVVYAGGNFTSVRPPGAAPGSGEVARKNIAAFDAQTGALLPFSHRFTSPNAAIPGGGAYDKTCSPGTVGGTYTCDTVYEIRASSDGTRIFVGGDFEAVDGAARPKVAAFTTANNALTSWRATSVYGRVRALTVTPSAVYIGGSFQQVNQQPRVRLAALNPTSGALLPFTASADALVNALATSPDNTRLIVGGEFDRINGADIRGLAAVDATTGASARWDSRPIPRYDANRFSFVTDLDVQGDSVFVSANGEGGGVFDGRLSANVYTGELNWVDYCLGATWSIEAVEELVYVGSHSHDCSRTTGGFSESWNVSPPAVPRYYRLLALSATGDDAPAIQTWYPTTNGGMVGKLGPRDMTATDNQLWVGGEFTTVNGVAQVGLTRFGMSPSAPRAAPLRPATPTVSSVRPGQVRVAFRGTEDIDDETLTYTILRGTTTSNVQPVGTVEADSKPWSLPSLSFTDTGLTPGATLHYQIQAADPTGRTSPKSYDAVATVATTLVPYPATVLDDDPALFWRLADQTSSSTAAAQAGPAGEYAAGVTKRQPGPLSSLEPDDAAVRTNGTSTGVVASSSSFDGPNVFTAETWFQSTGGSGKLFGFGNSQFGSSNSYDRHVYLRPDGRLTFGVYPNGVATVTSTTSYNDGQWHLVTASLGDRGMRLYVDGALVGSNASVRSAQAYQGYWRLGGDNLGGWPETGASPWFDGGLDEFAVFPTQLTDARVAAHYLTVNPDDQPPSVPTGLTARAIGTTVSASWTASTDNSGVDSYRVHLLPDATATPSAANLRATVSGTSAAIADVDPGSHVVRVVAVDVAGNLSAASDGAPVTVTAPNPYGSAVLNDGAGLYWPLDDASGSTASSLVGPTGTYGSGVFRGLAGAPIAGVTGGGVSTDGTSNGLVVSDQSETDPGPYSTEVWFRTISTSGGKIVGFGNATSGQSSNYDRHVIMLDDGRLQFGVWLGYTATVTSPASYNDGAWHHLVATLGAGGQRLYVDGTEVAGEAGVTGAQSYTGYWRLGGDTTWGGASSNWFAGDLDEFAVYPTQLSAAQVANHRALAGATPDTQAPTAPTGLAAVGGTGSAQLTWAASTDNVGIASYRLHRLASAGEALSAGNLVSTGTELSHLDEGLADGTYYYRVVATDAAGNRSEPSAAASVTLATPVDPVTLTVRPAADSWTDATAPTTNRGNGWALTSDGSPVQRTFFGFDLPAAPAGTQLVSATLRISTTNNAIAGSASAHQVALTDGVAWTELGVNDTNKPGVGPAVGTLPGGTAASSSYDVTLDVAALQSQLGSQASLVLYTAGGDALQIVSDEAPTSDRRPVLVVTYG